jgi:type I restriction enzyme R subunit
MVDVTYESEFEKDICEYLATHGWLYSPTDDGYDAERTLFPQDVFGWFEDLAPQAFRTGISAGTAKEKAARTELLDTIVALRSIPITTKGAGMGGTLGLLHNTHVPVGLRAELKMVQWAPTGTASPARWEAYRKNRLRIMRQVHYSANRSHRKSIDLVAFINGIPVATFELKTNFKQSIEAAEKQYARDRLAANEPLLQHGTGALVHFVVTETEVRMTTKLDGENTFFLPFNRGSESRGKGNRPYAPGKPATAYLWERAMAPDAWLNIFGGLMFTEVTKTTDPISRKSKTNERIIFPRFHQWEAVTQIVDQVKKEGVGGRFLIQHSAGSGKTNTIGWTAHQLSRLHDGEGRKLFDTVLVITDRTVLDDQLQRAVLQIEGKTDYVYNVDKSAKADAGSKSAATLKALQERRHIVVVTMQTFPSVLKILGQETSLAGHRFAVIADEAHSSQSGATAKKVRQVLASGRGEVTEDVQIDSEEALNTAVEDPRFGPSNISYFAFTATPKKKTVELFGRKPAPNLPPKEFHLYSMKQAIEEGFILDVLPRYQVYDTLWSIAEAVSKGINTSISDGEELVDEQSASSELKRYVRLHPTNIAQKVPIIVEHFRRNVMGLLDGHAKAMIVTSERLHALRYKREMDKYLTAKGYTDMGTLVAFSGTLKDPEYGIDEDLTEAKANPGVKGDLAVAFEDPQYKVMIAADKFQTGFDQPLLCAMYVDKRLEGVQAVQTLSRLNRTFQRGSLIKTTPYIVDFRNKPEDIKAAFEVYYEDSAINEETDPKDLHRLAVQLRTFGVFTLEDVHAFAQAAGDNSPGAHNRLSAVVEVPHGRFRARWGQAEVEHDIDEIKNLEQFRKDVSSFVRLFDFVSQIYDFTGSSMEDLAAFLRELARWITPERARDKVDISRARLIAIETKYRGETDASPNQKGQALSGPAAVGTAQTNDPSLVPLIDVIDKLNDAFGGQFSDETTREILLRIREAAKHNTELRSRALANTVEQFVASDKVRSNVITTMLTSQENFEKFFAALTAEGRTQDDGMTAILTWLYEQLHRDRQAQ